MILWDQKIVTSSIIHTGCIKKTLGMGAPLATPLKHQKITWVLGSNPLKQLLGWSSHLVSG